MSIIKCLIQRYDPAVMEPPFTFIDVGECEIDVPLYDDYGVNSARRCHLMFDTCQKMGFIFRFYSTSSNPKYDYILNVD